MTYTPLTSPTHLGSWCYGLHPPPSPTHLVLRPTLPPTLTRTSDLESQVPLTHTHLGP